MALQYQDFLLEEFRVRRLRNPNYSLRAFARDLEMPASKLSQNLRGLCGISVAKAARIADKLQLSEENRRLFLAMVEAQHARSRVARTQAAKTLESLRQDRFDEIQLEKFSAIRDWYHMVILELTELREFRPDIEWVAARLRLSPEVVKEAIQRLEELGLLDTRGERWRQRHQNMELPSGASSRAVREHHKQLLTKAMVAMDQIAPEKREYSVNTLAIDSRRLHEYKSLLMDFQRKVARLAASDEKDSVYSLCIQFFPVLDVEGQS